MVKKVHKHIPFGRTYNNQDGVGYKHYTKGNRSSRVDSKVFEKGSKFILEFLSKVVPNIKV